MDDSRTSDFFNEFWEGSTMHGIYIGNNRVLIKPAFGGKLLALADDLSLTPDLLVDGAFEVPLTKFLLGNVKPGQTVVDVGANIGYFTVLLAYLVGASGRVFAYEANPHLHGILTDNLSMNGVHAWTTLSGKAVYSRESQVTLHRSTKFNGNSSIYEPTDAYRNWFAGDDLEDITIKAEPLDHLLSQAEHFDLIKIDIEGGEYHAFLGMQEILRRGAVNTVAFEVNHFRNQTEWQEFVDLLARVRTQTGKKYYGLNAEGELVPMDLKTLAAQDYYPYVIMK